MFEWILFVVLVMAGIYHAIAGAGVIFMMFYLFKFKHTSAIGWVETGFGVMLLILALLSKPF